MTWPLAVDIGSRLPGDSSNAADPLLETWTLAWGGHALLHDPLHFFDANTFWPLHNSLAFSDSLAGFAPASIAGGGAHWAVVRYGLLFLFTYVLAFVGAYLLARELGVGLAGSVLAGAAFAYAPFRLAQQNHLHVLASGGIALSLALLVRGHRRRAAGVIVAGWLVALWQISLGWNLGLPFAYLLGVLALGTTLWWWRRPDDRPPRRVLAASLAGAAAASVGALLLALPYLDVVRRHPEARRTPDILFFFSPTPKALVAAPREDTVWGSVTSNARAEPADEKSLFPGATVLALGAVGLIWGRSSGRLRAGLAAGVLVLAVLSLGFGFHGGQASYRILYYHAPGWQGLRTPGRIATFTSLALALLAALGADRVVAAARRVGLRAAIAAACALSAFVLVEGYGTIGSIEPPARPLSLDSATPPLLLMPADEDLMNAEAMYWSIGRFEPVANGWSGFHPRAYVDLVARLHDFPDRKSIRALRAYGVRTVVARRADGTYDSVAVAAGP
jgi:hypothetical protein